MAEEGWPRERRPEQYRTHGDTHLQGAPPYTTHTPGDKDIEEIAVQTPPRSNLDLQHETAPANRTGDKPTERAQVEHLASAIPGAAKEG